MKNRNDRMLLFIGMADAFAAASEYLTGVNEQFMRYACLKFKCYCGHPTHGLRASFYTDDTEMSVANARVLIDRGVSELSPLVFASAWFHEFQMGGRRKGYSKGFQNLLENANSGYELLKSISSDSDKNGAAMRSVPFGVLPNIEELLRVATFQAIITHNTPPAAFSARVVALMSHFTLYEDAPFSKLPEYCLANLPKDDVNVFGYIFKERWTGGRVVGKKGGVPVSITTVHAVVDLLLHQASLMDILTQTIVWGGDTDSVAAIAWGIASARYQNEKLPEFLERDLEEGKLSTGAIYLRGVSTMLMEKYSP